MNVKIKAPEDYGEKEIKVPRNRNLLPSKKYRDTVKRWGEPTELKRRRLIIVPSIKCPARDVFLSAESPGKELDDTAKFEIRSDNAVPNPLCNLKFGTRGCLCLIMYPAWARTHVLILQHKKWKRNTNILYKILIIHLLFGQTLLVYFSLV